jgi:hypothetical protein
MEYAKDVLEPAEFDKLKAFVDDVFSGCQNRTIYFYGTGSNGKSTLLKKLESDYPDTFSASREVRSRARLYHENHPESDLFPGQNAIICLNELPRDSTADVVLFKKSFYAHMPTDCF